MQTIHVSLEFPLNRQMRKAVRRGKLEVIREGEGVPALGSRTLAENGNQAVDAFVSAFEAEARALPKKLAACGALFTIGAHKGLGFKILLIAPSGRGKTSLCQDYLAPLLPKAQGMHLHITSKNWNWESQLDGCDVFIRDKISPLKKWGPALAEWGGSVLLCASPAEIQKHQYSDDKFVCVEVSQEECNPQDKSAFMHQSIEDDSIHDDKIDNGEDSRLHELRKQLQDFPDIDKDSLLKKIKEL